MNNETDHEPGYFGKEDPSEVPTSGPGTGSAATGSVAAPPEPAPEVAYDDDDRHMGPLDTGHTHGPTERQYFTIFFVLFGLTALEVSTYFWEEWFGEGDTVRHVGVAVLLTVMVIKFVLIAGFFMHLRFDAALTRRVFGFGLGVALIIYLIAMTSLNIWSDNGNPWFNNPAPAVTPTTVAPEGG